MSLPFFQLVTCHEAGPRHIVHCHVPLAGHRQSPPHMGSKDCSYFVASYSSQIGNPPIASSRVTGELDSDGGL